MNKKILTVSLILASVLVFGSVFTVSAATVLNYNWTGGGFSTVTFDTGDAIMNFQTNGGLTSGSLYAKDFDNNPYSYGVDNMLTNVNAQVNNGGWIAYQVDRTDSYSPMYGAAGQTSYSYVSSDDGVATMAFQTVTNYASLVSSNYGFQANQQFTVSGTNIDIIHSLTTGNGVEGGSLVLDGTGTASVDYMTDGYTNYNQFEFGSGAGCYTNADVTASGAGLLTIGGSADNNMWANDGSWSIAGSGGVTHGESWSYNGLLTVNNYAFTGN